MEKVRRFFRNFNEKRSYQIVFFVVSMCVILGGYFVLRMKVAEEVSHRYTVVEDKNVIKFIENVCIEGDIFTISGWCFYNNVDSNDSKVQVFLRNIADEKDVVWLDVKSVIREDVNAYYDCAYDYRQVGFEAQAGVEKLNLHEKDYEIFIKVSYENEKQGREFAVTVSTDRYMRDGKVVTALAEETEGNKPIEMGELQEVFDRGKLLLCRRDIDLCVYQYEKKLYWVAGEGFAFEEDGTTYIQYQLETTKTSMLPEKRLKAGKYWDDMSFVFENQESVTMHNEVYRVVKKEIPSTYPVLYFITGYISDEAWTWKEYVNIDIREFIE